MMAPESCLRLLVLPFLTAGLSTAVATDPAAFPASQELKPLLKIAWREGPDYPMGIQDSVLSVLHGHLVSAGGFTRHPKKVVQSYPDVFGGKKSGFTNSVFALDLRQEDGGWKRLPNMPGSPRQAAAMAVVDDRLYAFGGINYTAPYTYRDCYRLLHQQGAWVWEKLPADLPWPVCEAGAVVLGKKIYLVGGADFFPAAGAKDADFHTETGRDGHKIGNALLELDTTDLRAGWNRLPDRPGTAQGFAACAAVAGKIYHLGGIFAPSKPGKIPYYNAVDSWVFDVAMQSWSRLQDMPHGANRRAVSFRDRYVLLIAGFKYGQTWKTDGTSSDVYAPAEKALEFKDHFEKTVLVFDTNTRQLGTADPLLDQTSYPMLAADGDRIYCLGGEGGGRLWHPATLQVGRVSELPANKSPP
jgi:N-acetylneuraminic acid mutarotase